ncbi:MAG: hypothetical protein D6735_07260, partial [Acidobacteria bacterium]
IDDRLEKIGKELRARFEQYVQHRQWQAHLDASPWYSPMRWNLINLRRYWRHCREDRQKNEALETNIEQTYARFDQVKEFPWSIALQAREVSEYIQQAKLLLSELASFGLHGEAYSNSFNRVREIEGTAKQIPIYFLMDPYEKIIAEVNQEDVRDVYEIVRKALPDILSIIQQAEIWKNRYLALEKQAELAQKELQRSAQLMSFLTEEIDLKTEKQRFEQWKDQLAAFEEQRKNLAVEGINDLASQMSHLIHEVRSNQRTLRQSRQNFFQFQRLIQANENLIAQIQDRFETLAQGTLKIEWDQSGERFRQLLDDFRVLSATKKPYPIPLLSQFVNEAMKIHHALLDVDRQTAHIASMHRSLDEMVNSPELKQSAEWIEAAKNLAASIRPYDPRNWPNRDWVLGFERQLQEVEAALRYWNENLAQPALSESSIEQVSFAIEEVYRQSLIFRERMNVIERVFRNLVNSENQSLALLKTARNQFAQITMFVLSQPLLAERAEKEIVQFDHRFDLCESAFQQREKDTLARKQAKLQQLIADVELAANRWMSVVENDCLKMLSDLEKRVDRLERIGQFDDGLIHRALQLIDRRERIFDFRQTARVNIPMEKMVLAMKKVFDTWQESFAVSKQLAEQIESPLLSIYQEFETLRQNAQAKFIEIERLIPAQRKWPPNSLMLTVERNEIAQLEEKWQQLRNQVTSVIHFVRALSEMVASYRSLLEKFLQYEQWAIQEQARIERIEVDIQRLD